MEREPRALEDQRRHHTLTPKWGLSQSLKPSLLHAVLVIMMIMYSLPSTPPLAGGAFYVAPGPNGPERHSRRQLLANAAIAASRVAS